MDDRCDGLTTEEIEQVLASRKYKANKCWKDFLAEHRGACVYTNAYFIAFLLVMVGCGGMLSGFWFGDYFLFGVPHVWSTWGPVGAAIFICSFCALFWTAKQIVGLADEFHVKHPAEADLRFRQR